MMDPEDVAFLKAQSAKARSSGKKGRNKRSRSDGEDRYGYSHFKCTSLYFGRFTFKDKRSKVTCN